MSMEKAIAALNTPANSTIPSTPTETPPTNMANTGANLTDQSLANQPRQEPKENDAKGQKSIEANTDGGVGAAIVEPTTAESKKIEDPKISQQFAALAKKEKALVKQQADIKAKDATYAQREAAISEREAKIKESESLWETDVLRALEMKMGPNAYQKITDMILSGKATIEKTPEDPAALAKRLTDEVRKEFADKEAKRDADIKAAAEAKKAADAKELAEAQAAYRESIINYTKENEAEYEFINMYGQHDLVVDTVNGFYEKYGRVLSLKEASDMTEKYLTDEAERARGAKKFSKAAPVQTPAEKVIENKLTKPAPTKTLTNNLTPTMASVLPAATDAERMKRALNKLNESQR